MRYKTGLLPSPHPPSLRFRSYFLPQAMPPVPAAFGHYGLVGSWGLLLNDQLGDCAVAGAMHTEMLWNAATKRQVRFTNLDAREDYFAITGGNDSGMDLLTMASYWQKTGFRDAVAVRHKIMAYVAVELGNIDEAAYLFDAVGLGVQVRESDEEAFSQGEPWTPQDDAVIGFHYVPYVGRDAAYRKVVTWGGLQNVTGDWIAANCKEAVAMIGIDALTNGKSVEGFDLVALQDDLQLLG